MRLLGGIDEAGLGPMLGPLCFGFVGFSTPRDERNLWQTLDSVVCREKGNPDRLIVADSKKIFPGAGGFQRLEETALAFHFAVHGAIPESLAQFLHLSPLQPSLEWRARHPWYREKNPSLPRRASRETVLTKGERLAAALEKEGIKILLAASRWVPEGELNGSFRITGNKSTTHFEKCAEAIRCLANLAGLEGGEIWIDRHGMRRRYAPHLAPLFPQEQLWILEEKRRESAYRIENGERKLEIYFVEKGEDKAFPIALASIFAKYTRELLMEQWNDYFSKFAPGVKPTAGYVTDARRYLREAGESLSKAQIAKELLIRER